MRLPPRPRRSAAGLPRQIFMTSPAPTGRHLINELYRRGITAGCGGNNLSGEHGDDRGDGGLRDRTQSPGFTPPYHVAGQKPPGGHAREPLGLRLVEEVNRRGIDTGCGRMFCPTRWSPAAR
jgi:hypothetical protein